MKYIEIKTAFENKNEAEQMAEELLDARLVACAQIFQISSHYVWKGKRERTNEFLLLAKTKKKLYNEIETFIKQKHSYELPEIVANEIVSGSKEYFEWIEENTK